MNPSNEASGIIKGQRAQKTSHHNTCSLDNNPFSHERSKQIELLKNTIKNRTESNAERILQLKKEISLGAYQVDSLKLASKMLEQG